MVEKADELERAVEWIYVVIHALLCGANNVDVEIKYKTRKCYEYINKHKKKYHERG